MKRSGKTSYTFLLLSFIFVLSASGDLFAQYKGSPVKKEKLINVIRSRQLQTREVVAVIKSNGVDFKVTPIIEAELRGAGARPEVIEAARDNYRSETVVPAKTTSAPSKFTGEPITKDAIITLLQNGVADAQVRKNVGARGVSFKASDSDKTDIKRAGGSTVLINLIAANYVETDNSSASKNDIGGKGSDRYDDLIEKAAVQYDSSRDVTGAVGNLEQAVKINPNEARAYQQLGFMYLYGQKNFVMAEKYMQEAIDRGGSAVFRVYHDHGALMTDTCEGSLFIAKDSVRFESDDNIHTFDAKDDSIKEAKMGGKFTSMFNARSGAFKIVLKEGDNKNFNFAPATNNSAESKMIVRLIGKKK